MHTYARRRQSAARRRGVPQSRPRPHLPDDRRGRPRRLLRRRDRRHDRRLFQAHRRLDAPRGPRRPSRRMGRAAGRPTIAAYDVHALGANTQGIATLQMLNMLETVRPARRWASSRRCRSIIAAEAKRLAYEDRARYYADPHFAQMPVEWLISKDYARRARQADPARTGSIPTSTPARRRAMATPPISPSPTPTA